MTSLNSKLQLAMLNRKKGRNLLEKGFTLVELMIVIVIVGVLSSVALPSFLNQRAKAEATEAVQKISVLLRDAVAELDGGQDPSVIQTTLDAAAKVVSNDEVFTYAVFDGGDNNAFCVVATGKAANAGGTPGTANKYVVGTLADGSRKPNVKSTLLTTTTITDDATCKTAAG